LGPADLQGTVTDSRKVPLPDVLVIGWPKGKRGEAVAQARTDEGGRFVLPRLLPGRWKLLVEAGGLGTLETERQVPEDGPAILMLEGESRALTGMVTDAAGRPQAVATVQVGSSGLRWTRSASSDANGIFTVAGLGSGRFTLRARLGPRVSPTQVVVLGDLALRPAHVRLSLQPGAIVEGRVLDDAGHALPGADVDVMAMPSDDLPVSGQSDREGKFRVGPIAPGKYQILARLEGYVVLDAPEPELGSRPSAWFDLRLARTAKVAGRVLDESGRPMDGVPVSAIPLIGGKDDVVVIPGALPLAAEAAELPVGNLLHPGGVRSGSTDRAGRFLITGLSPGKVRIEVRRADKLPFRKEPLLLAPGDARDAGDLVLLSGATLAGRVLGGDAGVEGALVEARPAGKSTHPAVRATTDPKGEFTLRLPRGDYWVTAQTQNLISPHPVTVVLRSDLGPESCTLQVAPRPAPAPRATGP
jgi:protocatechuate 3,4-dioxygenase beta subunit